MKYRLEYCVNTAGSRPPPSRMSSIPAPFYIWVKRNKVKDVSWDQGLNLDIQIWSPSCSPLGYHADAWKQKNAKKNKARIFWYFQKFSFWKFSKTPSLGLFCCFMKKIIMHHPVAREWNVAHIHLLSNLISNLFGWLFRDVQVYASITRCWQYTIIEVSYSGIIDCIMTMWNLWYQARQ